jgi:hypothetical protein
MCSPRSLPLHALFLGLGECADRYPLFSKTTCRSQSSFTFRINSSGSPIHRDLRCSHVVLVMVQAWFIAVQVARPSPISIETPPYCSTVRIESDIRRTNPRPRVTVSNLSTLPGILLHPCLGVDISLLHVHHGVMFFYSVSQCL